MQRLQCLCLLLCLAVAAGAASHPFTRDLASWRAQQPSVYALLASNTTFWDALGQPDWHERLLAVLPAVAAAAAPALRPHVSPLIPPSEEFPEAQECRWCLEKLQCEAKFFSLIGSFFAKELPQLVPRDAAAAAAAAAALQAAAAGREGAPHGPAEAASQLDSRWLQRLQDFAYELESSLLFAYIFLLRRQAFYAPIAPGILSQFAGWDWVELDGLPDRGPWSCWEQVALLRAAKLREGIGQEHSINYLLNFGPLRSCWQLHLDAFFQHSDEHSRPWTVEGNLLGLSAQSRFNFSTTVLWVLPARVFQESGYLDRPDSPEWLRFEGAGFVAAGFVWYPQIVAEGEEVKVAVRLWPGSLPDAGQRRRFSVSFAAVHVTSNATASPGPEDRTLGFECRWPEDFDPYHTCSLPRALPLHGMLTKRVPGFVPEGELLFRVSVAAAGQDGAAPGPLGGEPRLFSTSLLRLGYLYAERQLWGQHGFLSKRLPQSSAAAAEEALRTVQHWARMRTEKSEGAALKAVRANLAKRDPGSLWQLVWVLFERLNSRTFLGQGPQGAVLGSHAASALTALALVALPLAGWQLWRARGLLRDRRRRKQRPRSQQQAQQLPTPRRRPRQQQHRQRQQQQQAQQGAEAAAPTASRPATPMSTSQKAQRQVEQPAASSDGELHPLQLAASSPERPSSSQSVAGPSAGPAGPEAPATAGPAGEQRRLRRRKRRAAAEAVQQEQEGQQQQLEQQEEPEIGPPHHPFPDMRSPLAASLFAAADMPSAAGSQPRMLAVAEAGAAAVEAASLEQTAQPVAPVPPPPVLLPEVHLLQQQQQRQQHALGRGSQPTEMGVSSSLAEQVSARGFPLLQAVQASTAPPAEAQLGTAAGQEPATLPSAAARVPPAAAPVPAATTEAAAVQAAPLAAAPGTPPAGPATSGGSGGDAAAAAGLDDDSECVVCLEDRRCVVCVPCGHMVLCRRCADGLMARDAPLCPLCRAPVALAQRVWT